MYAGLAVASAIAGAIFWFLYHQFDAKEDDMNALEATQEEEEKPVAATEFTITRHGAERV